MKIKKILAWMLVLVVAYVTIYAYLNPDEIVYRVDDYSFVQSDVPKEPLVKETNPFVYYVLKYQVWLLVAGILYWLFDYKKSIELLKRFSNWWEKVSKKE